MIAMAQLIVRNLENDVRDKLRAMAAAHGRSMEEEVREILREAASRAPLDEGGLGSRVAERFRGWGLEGDVEELRGQPPRPADLES